MNGEALDIDEVLTPKWLDISSEAAGLGVSFSEKHLLTHVPSAALQTPPRVQVKKPMTYQPQADASRRLYGIVSKQYRLYWSCVSLQSMIIA